MDIAQRETGSGGAAQVGVVELPLIGQRAQTHGRDPERDVGAGGDAPALRLPHDHGRLREGKVVVKVTAAAAGAGSVQGNLVERDVLVGAGKEDRAIQRDDLVGGVGGDGKLVPARGAADGAVGGVRVPIVLAVVPILHPDRGAFRQGGVFQNKGRVAMKHGVIEPNAGGAEFRRRKCVAQMQLQLPARGAGNLRGLRAGVRLNRGRGDGSVLLLNGPERVQCGAFKTVAERRRALRPQGQRQGQQQKTRLEMS